MTSETLIQWTWAQTWQIAAVALFALVASRLWGRSRPHLGLLLWTIVFVKCLVPPVWSSPLGVFSWVQARVVPASAALSKPEKPVDGKSLFSQVSASLPGVKSLDLPVSVQPVFALPVNHLLLGSWLAGALAMAGAVVWRDRRGQRWIEATRVACDSAWQRKTQRLARRLGIRGTVQLVVCDAAIGPAAIGLLRPRLVLPQSLVAGRRFEELQAVLSHELIHIRRRDVWLLALELTAKIVWWFHPLVWFAGRQTARLRERCCDAETVACLGCRPAVYARSLLDVLEHLQVMRRGFPLAPGVRPAEVTLKRLEIIMREAHTFRKRTPRYAWLLVGLAAVILVPGSPLLLRGQAEPTDSPEVAAKIDQLENAGRQAGLSREELLALIEAAKATKADKKKLVQVLCADDATAAQKQAFEKIVRVFGHPLEDQLVEVREVARRAGLTPEETAAAEKVALATGFNGDAIMVRYETGKMSAIEKSAFEKVIALQGHPKAKEIEGLTAAAQQAGLSDAELQTLRGLGARAGWNLDQIIAWKVGNQLSEAEAAALAKLEAGIGPLELAGDGDANDKQSLLLLIKAAGCSSQETSALLMVLKKGEVEDPSVIAAVRAGQHTEAAASGLKKLETLLGNLEDFLASPHKDTVGEMLKTATAAKLTAEETGVMLKVALKAGYNLETIKQWKASGQLDETQSQVLEKLRQHLGR